MGWIVILTIQLNEEEKIKLKKAIEQNDTKTVSSLIDYSLKLVLAAVESMVDEEIKRIANEHSS